MERSGRSNGTAVWLIAAGTLLAMLVLTLSGAVAQKQAKAQEVITAYALTLSDDLLEFDVENPNDTERVEVTGLRGNETLVGIDFRPSAQPPNTDKQGALYGVGSKGNVYTIDTDSGDATFETRLLRADAQGNVIIPRERVTLEGSSFGVDFNPTVDRLRIVSEDDQNLRANVDTGATITDGELAFADGDENEGTEPWVSAAAYRNSLPTAFGGATELYDLGVGLDILADQTPANDGTLNTVGDLGPNIKLNTGFDIVTIGASPGGDMAYAALRRKGETKASGLFEVDLETGKASSNGRIDGPRTKIKGLAIPIGGGMDDTN